MAPARLTRHERVDAHPTFRIVCSPNVLDAIQTIRIASDTRRPAASMRLQSLQSHPVQAAGWMQVQSLHLHPKRRRPTAPADAIDTMTIASGPSLHAAPRCECHDDTCIGDAAQAVASPCKSHAEICMSLPLSDRRRASARGLLFAR